MELFAFNYLYGDIIHASKKKNISIYYISFL